MKLVMGQARDRRKRDEKKRGGRSHREDAKLDVRRRVKTLLQRFKLLALFEAMPAEIRQQFFDFCGPEPVLVFDESFPSAEAFGGAYAQIRADARAGFDEANIVLNGFELPVRDFYAIALPLASMVANTHKSTHLPFNDQPRQPATVRAFLEEAVGILRYLTRQEVVDASFTALHKAVVVSLVSRSRLDGNLLHARLMYPRMLRGKRLTMTLHAEKPAMKYVRLNNGVGGGSRPMHRVGTPNAWNGIEWASWSRSTLKGHWQDELKIDADAQWPVFVQSHALKQLRDRLDVYAYADWAEHWLHQSLARPKIVSRMSENRLLVAYEVLGKRLGYLVVTAADGCVGVRTFLFLTMAHTPEGKLLEKRLKLTRDEVSYWRLHELSRFTQTDLKDDPEMRRTLTECGCGHLFELAEDEHALTPTAQTITPFAAELKQYLGVAA